MKDEKRRYRGQFLTLAAVKFVLPVIVAFAIGIFGLGVLNDPIKAIIGIDLLKSGVFRPVALFFAIYIGWLIIQNLGKAADATFAISTVPLLVLIGLGIVFLNFGLTGNFYSVAGEGTTAGSELDLNAVVETIAGTFIAGIALFYIDPRLIRLKVRR